VIVPKPPALVASKRPFASGVDEYAVMVPTRLEEFYATEGRDEPFILVIPKGKYVPVFVERVIDPVATQAIALPEPDASFTAPPPPESKTPVRLADQHALWSLFQSGNEPEGPS
jgi:hypothetical protein